MNQSSSQVWYTEWWNHALCFLFLCREKWYWQVGHYDISHKWRMLFTLAGFHFVYTKIAFQLDILISCLVPYDSVNCRCQRANWNLWSIWTHLSNSKGIQKTVKVVCAYFNGLDFCGLLTLQIRKLYYRGECTWIHCFFLCVVKMNRFFNNMIFRALITLFHGWMDCIFLLWLFLLYWNICNG